MANEIVGTILLILKFQSQEEIQIKKDGLISFNCVDCLVISLIIVSESVSCLTLAEVCTHSICLVFVSFLDKLKLILSLTFEPKSNVFYKIDEKRLYHAGILPGSRTLEVYCIIV